MDLIDGKEKTPYMGLWPCNINGSFQIYEDYSNSDLAENMVLIDNGFSTLQVKIQELQGLSGQAGGVIDAGTF